MQPSEKDKLKAYLENFKNEFTEVLAKSLLSIFKDYGFLILLFLAASLFTFSWQLFSTCLFAFFFFLLIEVWQNWDDKEIEKESARS